MDSPKSRGRKEIRLAETREGSHEWPDGGGARLEVRPVGPGLAPSVAAPGAASAAAQAVLSASVRMSAVRAHRLPDSRRLSISGGFCILRVPFRLSLTPDSPGRS